MEASPFTSQALRDELEAAEAFKQRALARQYYRSNYSSAQAATPSVSQTPAKAPYSALSSASALAEPLSIHDKLRSLQSELAAQASSIFSSTSPLRTAADRMDPRDRPLADHFTRQALSVHSQPPAEASTPQAAPLPGSAVRPPLSKPTPPTHRSAGSPPPTHASHRSDPASHGQPSRPRARSSSLSSASSSGSRPPLRTSERALRVQPEDVETLKRQMEDMQRQISELTALTALTPPGKAKEESVKEVEGLRGELQDVIRVLADVISASSEAPPPSNPLTPIRPLPPASQPSPLAPPSTGGVVSVDRLLELLAQQQARRSSAGGTGPGSAAPTPSASARPSAALHPQPLALNPAEPGPLTSPSAVSRRLFTEEGNSGASRRLSAEDGAGGEASSRLQPLQPQASSASTDVAHELMQLRLTEAENHIRFLVSQVSERDAAAGELRREAAAAGQARDQFRKEAEDLRVWNAELSHQLETTVNEADALREECEYYRAQLGEKDEVAQGALEEARERVRELEEGDRALRTELAVLKAAAGEAARAEALLRALCDSTERRLRGESSAWEEALKPQPAPAPEDETSEAPPEQLGSRLAAQVERMRGLILRAQVEGAVASGAVNECGVQ